MIKVITVLGCLLLLSCVESEYSNEKKVTPKVLTCSNEYNYELTIVDGCEYLHGFRRFSHKGNCKQCTEVRKEEVSEALELLLTDPRFRHLRE